MQQVTLKKVGQRALKDRRFFDGLIKDASGTLERAGMSLKAPDLTALKRSVAARKGRTQLGKFIRSVHVGNYGGLMEAPWDVDWMQGVARRAKRAKRAAKRAAKRVVKRAAKRVRARR